MLHVRFCAFTLALLGFALAATAQSKHKVIANPSVSTTGLEASEISRIFLKKTGKWPDGAKVVPVDQRLGSSVRESFSQSAHQKSAAAVDAYWQKRIFSGRGLPPLIKGSDAEVVTYVKNTPGAIGYVSSGRSTAGVKVIEVR